MGLISRTSMIVKSKVSSFLGSIEDPRETLDYSYDQLLEMRGAVKRGIVEMVTAKHVVQQQADKAKSSIERLEQQARQAVDAGRDDLARLALSRKADTETELGGLSTQLDGMEKEQQKLTDAEARLGGKINAFRVKKELMKAEYSAAEAQVRVGAALGGVSEEMNDITMSMERAQDKTDQMKAKAVAIDELVDAGVLDGGLDGKDDIDRELAKITATGSVEVQLAALKGQSVTGSVASASGEKPREEVSA